ncbi:hypothetical protein TIFTF001_014705 [Ficus carica]|uniref:Uncharacterized protein n=1 Tax=Ficus carica TaxID=3494 RepID=A0AA88D4D0_FICCA|nr:hypothetical protein TIFTF001_014705 [Ficus carica]
MGHDETQPPPFIFKPKKGSVFPAKRRSVKNMIFHQILHSISVAFVFLLRCRRQFSGEPLHSAADAAGESRRPPPPPKTMSSLMKLSKISPYTGRHA